MRAAREQIGLLERSLASVEDGERRARTRFEDAERRSDALASARDVAQDELTEALEQPQRRDRTSRGSGSYEERLARTSRGRGALGARGDAPRAPRLAPRRWLEPSRSSRAQTVAPSSAAWRESSVRSWISSKLIRDANGRSSRRRERRWAPWWSTASARRARLSRRCVKKGGAGLDPGRGRGRDRPRKRPGDEGVRDLVRARTRAPAHVSRVLDALFAAPLSPTTGRRRSRRRCATPILTFVTLRATDSLPRAGASRRVAPWSRERRSTKPTREPASAADALVALRERRDTGRRVADPRPGASSRGELRSGARTRRDRATSRRRGATRNSTATNSSRRSERSPTTRVSCSRSATAARRTRVLRDALPGLEATLEESAQRAAQLAGATAEYEARRARG